VCVSRPQVEQIDLCFFALAPSDLRDPRKRIVLAADDIRIFNPNTNTLPILRSEQDLLLLRRLYRVGVPLVSVSGPKKNSSWGADFLRMFDMTLDSGLFSEREASGRIPLYEAKMFWHFDHRWANATDAAEARLPDAMKTDPTASARARFYIDRSEVETKLRDRGWKSDWLIAYRNVSDSRNERTFVAAAIPRCGAGNSATVMTIRQDLVSKAGCLLAVMNSLVFDYAVRQKVPAMNVNVFMVEQFPFPRPDQFSDTELVFINPRIIELSYTSNTLTAFARDFGYDGPPFRWDPDRRALLKAELDAYFAYLYGLSRDELRYILDPKEVMGADYPSETFRVRKENEIRAYDEYRTRRLVLGTGLPRTARSIRRGCATRPISTPCRGRSSRRGDGSRASNANCRNCWRAPMRRRCRPCSLKARAMSPS
jgi:hypothetical protein